VSPACLPQDRSAEEDRAAAAAAAAHAEASEMAAVQAEAERNAATAALGCAQVPRVAHIPTVGGVIFIYALPLLNFKKNCCLCHFLTRRRRARPRRA
jgi:hypothetical protein